ncbi:MAG: (2Fe-2S) ferredoxin domain-containing protein [Thermoanaerobaculia bacterium]
MPKLTLEDLKKKREEARSKLYLRDGEFRGKVIVHMGTCGIAAGAREIVEQFLEEVEKNNARDIQITTSGCAGLCSKEPMATVEIKGAAPVKYITLSRDKVKKIFKEHILEGKIVAEYALGVGSEKGG